MKHEADFQLRLTKVNCCHKIKVKIRDKSYQDLDEEKLSVLSVKEVEISMCMVQDRVGWDY